MNQCHYLGDEVFLMRQAGPQSCSQPIGKRCHTSRASRFCRLRSAGRALAANKQHDQNQTGSEVRGGLHARAIEKIQPCSQRQMAPAIGLPQFF